MMKRVYEKMTAVPVSLATQSSVLTGSLTVNAIKVNSVNVEDYDAGFVVNPGDNDFKDVSFD